MINDKRLEDTFEKIAKASHLVKWIGDPILRTKCEEIPLNEITADDSRALADELVSTLRQTRNLLGLGRGLAAPQIGIAKRMVAIFLDDKFDVYVNPTILQRSDALGVYPEMCLSAMPESAEVIRPWQIEVEYLDIDGNKHTKMTPPILSRLLQHEIDHLNGIMFVDKADPKTIRFVDDFGAYLSNSALVQVKEA